MQQTKQYVGGEYADKPTINATTSMMKIAALLAALECMMLTIASAQQLDPLPQVMLPASEQRTISPTIEPTRPQENLESGPDIKSAARTVVPLRNRQTVPKDAAAATFVFTEMNIEGVHSLEKSDLMAEWPHKPGDITSVEDVFRFANAITRVYSEEGYALSFAIVPEQDIENGTVVIRVLEGFVDHIEFIGDGAARLQGSPILRRVEKTVSKILKSRPLRTADLERYVLLANDLPGIEVSATLRPSSETTGAAELAVQVRERKPFAKQVGYNNYMPASLDRHVAGATANFNGMIAGSEQISFSGWHSAASGAYWSASGSGSIGIGEEGFRIGVSGLYSNSDPNTEELEALEYLGESASGRVFVNHALIRRRTKNLILESSLAVTNSRSEILGDELVRDRLRTLGVSATYDFADATSALTFVRVGFERGLDILNAQGNSRSNGEVGFNVTTFEAQRTQPIMEAFSGTVSVQLAVRGQGTFGSGGLFSGNECAFGGRRYGRAYDSGVLTGEHCGLGSGELKWAGRFGSVRSEFYGFSDGGYLWQKGALEAGELRRRSAASAGGGIRLLLTDHVSGVVEGSWAVIAPTGATSTDNFRLNAGVQARF